MTTLLTAQQFFDEFFAHCRNAKQRIWVQAMIVEAGSELDQFVQIASPLAKTVQVRLQYDWISTRSLHGETPLFPVSQLRIRKEFSLMQERTAHALDTLESAGAMIKMLNVPWLFPRVLPITGRNHTKIYIVDSVAWIGGCNFFDRSAEAHDVMIRCENEEYVRFLVHHFEAVNDRRPKGNAVHILHNGDAFLTDCGLRGTSIIYDQAVMMAQKAKKEIVLASQFTPTGKLLDALIGKAKSGIPVHIYTSHEGHPHFTTLPHTIPHGLFMQKVRHQENITVHHSDRQLHAKVLMVDSHSAMVGSHNYVDTGVLLGTEEIALRTEQPQIIRGIQHFIDTLPITQ